MAGVKAGWTDESGEIKPHPGGRALGCEWGEMLMFTINTLADEEPRQMLGNWDLCNWNSIFLVRMTMSPKSLCH